MAKHWVELERKDAEAEMEDVGGHELDMCEEWEKEVSNKSKLKYKLAKNGAEREVFKVCAGSGS